MDKASSWCPLILQSMLYHSGNWRGHIVTVLNWTGKHGCCHVLTFNLLISSHLMTHLIRLQRFCFSHFRSIWELSVSSDIDLWVSPWPWLPSSLSLMESCLFEQHVLAACHASPCYNFQRLYSNDWDGWVGNGKGTEGWQSTDNIDSQRCRQAYKVVSQTEITVLNRGIVEDWSDNDNWS